MLNGLYEFYENKILYFEINIKLYFVITKKYNFFKIRTNRPGVSKLML